MSRQFQIGSRWIGGQHPCFVIAEIGQNHQGDFALAKRMIVAAKECGADCVKFQKSCLPEKFTQDALTQPYVGPNAWAPTYGAHKEHLEFTVDQFAELQHFAEAHVGIMFTASAMDAVSLQQLNRLNVPFIKIGSGDANNIPLLEEAARLQRPLVISTGMQSERMIARIVSIMETAQQPTTQRDYALLHCVSAYPTMATDSRLLRMTQLQQHFGDVCVVGYSGHESGIGVTLASVVLGAKIVERHFTLDRNQRGTDHQISLTPCALKTLVEKIRYIDNRLMEMPAATTPPESQISVEDCSIQRVKHVLSAAGISGKELDDVTAALAPIPSDMRKQLEACELPCWQKLGKSLVYNRPCPAGQIVQSTDICFKVSPIKGLLDEHYYDVIGKRLTRSVSFEEPVFWTHFESN